MTLQALLDAVENWQQADAHSTDGWAAEDELQKVDIPALRLACQQHGEALRANADIVGSAYDVCDSAEIRAAADFLSPTQS